MRLPFKSTAPADPLGPPSLTVEYVLGLITMLVGLFTTQGFITNGTEKLITGLASILVPLALVIVQAILKSRAKTAKANIHAAEAANPPAGLNLGDVQQLLQAYTNAVAEKIDSTVKSPPTAQEVAQQIIADASANAVSAPTPAPAPPAV